MVSVLSSRLYHELVNRAIHFFKISSYDADAGRYDIALFHLEQAVQLALKAYLLKTVGDFPKIHSLKELIEVCEDECLKKLANEKWYIIDILEDAYIGGRYFIRKYDFREYEESKKFIEEMFRCIGISSI